MLQTQLFCNVMEVFYIELWALFALTFQTNVLPPSWMWQNLLRRIMICCIGLDKFAEKNYEAMHRIGQICWEELWSNALDWTNLLRRSMKRCIGLDKFSEKNYEAMHWTGQICWEELWRDALDWTNSLKPSQITDIFSNTTPIQHPLCQFFQPKDGNSTFLQSKSTKWRKKPNDDQHCYINHYENLKVNNRSKLHPGSMPGSVGWETYSKPFSESFLQEICKPSLK